MLIVCALLWPSFNYGQTRQRGWGVSSQDNQVLKEMDVLVKNKIIPRYTQQSVVKSDEAKRLVESGIATLVDVRGPEEWQVSMLPNAVTSDEFKKNAPKYEGQVIIFYCTIGWRSGEWASVYDKLGWRTMNLIGGVLAWSHFGYSFVNLHQGLTDSVHVYSEDWNYLNSKYYAVH